MSKRTILLAVCIVFAMGTVRADDDLVRLATALCDYTKANDRSMLRKKLKDANLNLRRIYGGLLCAKDDVYAGGTLLRTAVAHNAGDSMEFILSQVGSSATSTPEHDGRTIIEWTEEAAKADPAKADLLAKLKEASG